MNAILSFQRLSGLIRKQWIENNRFYLAASLALFGLLSLAVIIFWILMNRSRFEEKELYFIYITGLFLAGTIFASMGFSHLGNKEKGMSWLTFPASHTEKLITVFFYHTVLFFLVYSACFQLVKWLTIAFVKNYYIGDRQALFVPVNWHEEMGTIVPVMLIAFLAIQSLYLLGSLYFKQHSFIKTTLVMICLAGMYIFFVTKAYQVFFPDMGLHLRNNIELRRHHDPGNFMIYQSYSLGPVVANTLEFLLKCAWVPVILVITWFRLGEKEI